jgi:hypothetical protein
VRGATPSPTITSARLAWFCLLAIGWLSVVVSRLQEVYATFTYKVHYPVFTC